MHIVAVQLDMQWQDKPTNFRKVRELLAATTIPAGALIVLPEMFPTGFSMNLAATAPTAAREAETLLQEMAREYESAVLGGVVGPLRPGGKATNEAVAFAPDGQELVRYVKQHPFSVSGEGTKYQAGESHAIFHWQGVRIAPFVCYDLRFPELFRRASADEAELIVVIACWPAIRSEHWVRLLQARAIENLAACVGVNRCGSEPNLTFDGRSTAFDCQGRSLGEADGREQVLHFEIDIDSVRDWRKTFPALRDRKDITPHVIGG